MNEELRLKEQDIKLKKFTLMKILTLINDGSKQLKEKNIYSHKIDSEILLSQF